MGSGKVALVTGGSKGIGRGIATCLVRDGVNVVISYLNDDKVAAETAEYLSTFGVKARPVKADVGNYAEVSSAIEGIIKEFGQLDILVNNAGIHLGGRLHKLSLEAWGKVLQTNLFGVFHCCRASIPYMLENGQGRIINIASPVGIVGHAGDTAYASSKSGVIGLTKSLALELARENILVNAIAPGFVKTEMTSGLSENSLSRIENSIPIGRAANAEEIGAMVAFLASPGASYITGAIIPVDGGLVAD